MEMVINRLITFIATCLYGLFNHLLLIIVSMFIKSKPPGRRMVSIFVCIPFACVASHVTTILSNVTISDLSHVAIQTVS